MTEKELIQDFVKSQRELKQKLIKEHRERISRGEELDFVCFELYKELQEQLDEYDLEMGLHRCHERIEELEAQIEKMKCGQNCKHSYLYQEDMKCEFTYCDCINCKDKWELKE